MIYRMLITAALILPLAGEAASGQSVRRRERIAAQEAAPGRQQLEQRLRTGMARVVKQRIGLTDEQMSKLAQTNARYDARRRALVREERSRRVELRSQVLAGQGADQNRIAAALDRVLELQRQRIDLQIEEQGQLAAFMTPLQRAKYAALQEQIRRRVQGIRAGGAKAPVDGE
jgi:periplasmic protein CpxP/Spy